MRSRASTDDASNAKPCGANELPLQDAGTDKLISFSNPAGSEQSAGFFLVANQLNCMSTLNSHDSK